MRRSFIGKVLSDEQKSWLDKQKAPCGHSVALEHLDWLAAHKRMEKDIDRMTILKRDYSELLSSAPEYALALAVVWFIEEGKGQWWPVLDDLKAKVEEFIVPGSEVYAETNGYSLAKDRLGEVLARAWFSRTILHEKTLYGDSAFVCDWIKNNCLEALKPEVEDVLCVKYLTFR